MITIKARKLASFLEKSLGLIGKKVPEAVYFETRFGIHTFGLLFPIDVVILNHKNRVVAVKENLPPSSFYFWNPRFKNVIELPVGTIKEEKITIGMKIRIYKPGL